MDADTGSGKSTLVPLILAQQSLEVPICVVQGVVWCLAA